MRDTLNLEPSTGWLFVSSCSNADASTGSGKSRADSSSGPLLFESSSADGKAVLAAAAGPFCLKAVVRTVNQCWQQQRDPLFESNSADGVMESLLV